MSTQILHCSTPPESSDPHIDYPMEEANKSVESFESGLEMEPKSSEVDPGSEEMKRKEKKKKDDLRAEIDTSAPFESVKEAVSRFGGIGYWKPHSHKFSETSEHDFEEVDIAKVEEQAAKLEKDLILKERETLEVLKDLEATKLIVEELKSKLQKEAYEVDAANATNSDDKNVNSAVEEAEKENHENPVGSHQNCVGDDASELVLMELKQAKLNLTRTTTDLADIRATVESYNKKLEKEKTSLEKTRERLNLNFSKISSMEEELGQTKVKLQLVKDAEVKGANDSPMDVSKELQMLSTEAEQFKKMGEAAKLEVLRAMSDIEQTKTSIKTAEIRLVAAKKMKKAARAAEAVALAEIKMLSNIESSSGDSVPRPEGVTLSSEEYSSLTCKAREAAEESTRRVVGAMLQVDEANALKGAILRKVEEATKEVKSSRKVLEEALDRVEAANRGKLAVEEALRRWRSEHGQRRRSIQNSTKFKNSCSSHHQKNSRMLDVNGLNLANDESIPVLRPTLSIGQILSRKLLLTEEYENGIHVGKGSVKRKSLGQMLNKPNNGYVSSARKAEKENDHKQSFPAKRKKFGFARFSLLTTKQSKKKKQQTPN